MCNQELTREVWVIDSDSDDEIPEEQKKLPSLVSATRAKFNESNQSHLTLKGFGSHAF